MAATALVTISGVTAALTLGFFTLDKMEMEVLKISGTDKEASAEPPQAVAKAGMHMRSCTRSVHSSQEFVACSKRSTTVQSSKHIGHLQALHCHLPWEPLDTMTPVCVTGVSETAPHMIRI